MGADHVFARVRRVATAEDTIIAKLEWAKLGESSQIDDAASIIRLRDAHLDREYIERWVGELGLDEQWRQAQARAR